MNTIDLLRALPNRSSRAPHYTAAPRLERTATHRNGSIVEVLATSGAWATVRWPSSRVSDVLLTDITNDPETT